MAGATLTVGRAWGDRSLLGGYPTILSSIKDKLLTLPPQTEVHTGHGKDTSIGAEAADYDDWRVRIH